MDPADRRFTFDGSQARAQFRRVDERQIVQALLALVTPRPGWEGCQLELGTTTHGDADQVCVHVHGPGAAEVQQALAQALERFGLSISPAADEPCAGQAPLARLQAGQWRAS